MSDTKDAVSTIIDRTVRPPRGIAPSLGRPEAMTSAELEELARAVRERERPEALKAEPERQEAAQKANALTAIAEKGLSAYADIVVALRRVMPGFEALASLLEATERGP